MDINGNVDAEQRNIEIYPKHGKINQQWDLIYTDEWKTLKKGDLNEDFGMYIERDFHIVTQLKSNRYLSTVNKKDMVIKTPNGFKSQIWYFDQASLTIRSRENNRSWDIKNAGRTSDMQVWSTNSGWFQIFRYEEEHFINAKGKALDVHGGKDEEARKVIVYNRHNGANQKWTIKYLDQVEDGPKKGLNKDFGFEINRPFYIRSRMTMNRFIAYKGNSSLGIKSWVDGDKDFKWVFDGT